MSEQRVFPREAMTAERGQASNLWYVGPQGDPNMAITDAEFAEAFRPASDLDELIAAVREIAGEHGRYQLSPDICAGCRLAVALRRWDGVS